MLHGLLSSCGALVALEALGTAGAVGASRGVTNPGGVLVPMLAALAYGLAMALASDDP